MITDAEGLSNLFMLTAIIHDKASLLTSRNTGPYDPDVCTTKLQSQNLKARS